MLEDAEFERLVNGFFKDFWRLRYEQTLVSTVVGATSKELNTWRERKQIGGAVWGRQGGVFYTGHGLVVAGLLKELSWAIGPAKTQEFAEDSFPILQGIVDGHASEWGNLIAEFRFQDEKIVSYYSKSKETGKKYDTDQHASIVLPFGFLLKCWALKARMLLESGLNDNWSPEE